MVNDTWPRAACRLWRLVPLESQALCLSWSPAQVFRQQCHHPLLQHTLVPMVSTTLRATKPAGEAGCPQAGPQQCRPAGASSLEVVLGGLDGLHGQQGGRRSDLNCDVTYPRGIWLCIVPAGNTGAVRGLLPAPGAAPPAVQCLGMPQVWEPQESAGKSVLSALAAGVRNLIPDSLCTSHHLCSVDLLLRPLHTLSHPWQYHQPHP